MLTDKLVRRGVVLKDIVANVSAPQPGMAQTFASGQSNSFNSFSFAQLSIALPCELLMALIAKLVRTSCVRKVDKGKLATIFSSRDSGRLDATRCRRDA
jgi:hypothetical protein